MRSVSVDSERQKRNDGTDGTAQLPTEVISRLRDHGGRGCGWRCGFLRVEVENMRAEGEGDDFLSAESVNIRTSRNIMVLTQSN